MKAGQQSGRKQGDSGVLRDRSDLLVFGLGAIGVVLIASVLAFGQSPQGGNGGQHGGQSPGVPT